VIGLGGDDARASAFDHTTLIGRSRDDAVTTRLAAEGAPDDPAGPAASRAGGAGHDTLLVTAAIDGVGDVCLRQSGGPGDDLITAEGSVSPQDGGSAASEVLLRGGAGTVNASAAVDGVVSSAVARVTVLGRSGDDVIAADATVEGSIEIEAEFDFAGIDVVDGGHGRDAIVGTVDAVSFATAEARCELSGGRGADRIDAVARASGVENDRAVAVDVLSGGRGDDVMTASADASEARNEVRGGAGDDVVLAETSVTTSPQATAASEVFGGAGDDRLAVTGGSADVAEGGAGRDLLQAGGGTPPRPGAAARTIS
jgi:hypothetical protein